MEIGIIDEEKDKSHYIHEDFISLMYILFFAFGFAGYFFYFNSKKLKKVPNQSNSIIQKQKVLYHLCIANSIRCLSLIYIIIIRNKNGYDIVSFINFLLHIIPTLIFISILFSYFQFLIEKYYEMISKKSDVFFAPGFDFFMVLVYVTLFVMAISCLTMKQFKIFSYVAISVVSLMSTILGIFYLYYGVKISNYYSDSYKESEEKMQIYKRMLLITAIVGISYLLRGVISFMISFGWFGREYPSFLKMNVRDFLGMLFNELICSLIVGYSKKHRKRNFFAEEVERYEFNQNNMFKNVGNLNMIEKKDNNRSFEMFKDLNNPLLEEDEKEEENLI